MDKNGILWIVLLTTENTLCQILMEFSFFCFKILDIQEEKRNLIVHNYLLKKLASSRELAKRLSLPKLSVARMF